MHFASEFATSTSPELKPPHAARKLKVFKRGVQLDAGSPILARCETLIDDSVWASAPERFALARAYHDVAEVIGWDRAIAFGMAVWEVKRLPSRAATDPVHGGGHGAIYIPKSLSDKNGRSREIVRLAGAEIAAALVGAFPGMTLMFPCIVSASIGRRNRAIAEQAAAGHTARSVAWSFDLTERQVRRIVQKES